MSPASSGREFSSGFQPSQNFLSHPGTPADIGHAALFLMTNPYVTGTVLEVSGGELLVDWLF